MSGNFKRKYLILNSVSAMTMLMGSMASATDQAEDEIEVEEIVVSSSRIKKSGFEAPSPVTVLSVDDLEARGTTNVADILNELPSFSATRTPSSTVLNSRGNGTNAVDLRGLGGNRNLVLVNGRRHVPSDEFGNVDLNVIPTLAVKRIDIVTGGASAAWGSDAVSGVVNVIYDKNLEGLKLEAQYGVSGQGDAENYRLSMAFGSEVGDGRGHVLIAADYNDNKGIPLATARDWALRHPGLLAVGGSPANIIRDNVSLFLASPNGVTLPGGPLGNLEFLPDGTAIPRSLGNIGGVLMEGGSGSFLGDSAALLIPVERTNVMAAFDYDITEDVNFYFEGSAGQSNSTGALVDSFLFGQPIFSGNPYLPASVQQTMDDTGEGALVLFRTNSEFGPISSVSQTNNYRFVAGLNGDFDDNWSWDLYYQYGRTDFSNRQINNLIPGNMALAADAVLDPDSGNIVCAAALSGVDPNCVPINLFGVGSPSQEAIDYVTGTSISDTQLKQQVVAASINGDLFEGWAGPITTAFGAEYRKESLKREVDDLSEQALFLITNAQPLEGDYDVKEVFGEVLVPILDEGATGQSLNFNGAVRYTDYSTSGTVVTWKAGLAYNPIRDLRLRGTISRDIRAPSIGEVFLKTLLLFGNIGNPFTGNVDFATILNTGNNDLKEESALTKTVGMVYSPEWLDNFQVSVDWYDIDIEDAIQGVSSQSIVDECSAGNAEFCDLINFAPDNTVLEITNKLLNLGTFRVRGFDFEGRYMTEVGDNGTLGFKVLGSYVYAKDIAPDGSNEVNFAGEVGSASGFGLPKWKIRSNISYDNGGLGLFSQIRYVGAGKYNVQWGPAELADSENNIGAEIYVDMSARYRFEEGVLEGMEIFGGVNNVFDNEPPVIPLDFIGPTATNAVHYDVIGRSFYFGVRAKF